MSSSRKGTPPATSMLPVVFPGGSEMAQRCRAIDWSATPLGPVDTWPASLRTTTAVVLGSGFPMILVWGPEHIQIYNDAYIPLIGGKHPDALAIPTHDCWPEIRHIQEPIFERVFRGETVNLHGARYSLNRSGTSEDLYFDATFVPVPLEDGMIGGSISTLLDVTARITAGALETERDTAETALHQSETRFRTLAELSPDAMLINVDGRYAYANPAAVRLLGARDVDQIIGRSPFDFVEPEFHDLVRERIRRVLEMGLANRLIEYRWRRFDGSSVEVEVAAGPVTWNGDPAVQVVARDIDERKRTEAEREKFRLAVEHANDGHGLFDSEGRLLWANRLMSERLGYTLEELQTLSVPDFNMEVSLARYKNLFEQARRGRVPPFEAVHRRKDGTTFPVEITPTVVNLAEGPRMFSSIRDISERKHAEQEREHLLRETEAARAEAEAAREQLGRVFQHAPAYIATVRGPDHVFQMANPIYRQLVGDRELIGKPAREAVPELIEQGYIELLDQVYHTGQPYVATEARVLLRRGPEALPQEHFINFVYQPLFDASGVVEGILAHGVDVTQQVRARREIESARAEAEAANRAKSEFLAVMSHELRTPLNAIGGYSELIEMGIRGPVTEAQREDLARIQASQRHLLGLINEVLNYAKLETGSVRYDISNVPVRGALLDAEALVAPQVRAKELTLRVGACAAEVAVRADAEKLRQILVNLLSNAVKFTDSGVIQLQCEVEDEQVAVRIQDTGIGIPAEKLEAVFEPFVQVRADLARTAEGTGLGLAISRDLARGMGGELVLESVLGEGSTFTLRLPSATE